MQMAHQRSAISIQQKYSSHNAGTRRGEEQLSAIRFVVKEGKELPFMYSSKDV